MYRPSLPVMVLGVVAINLGIAFVVDTISDALTPTLGEGPAFAFAALPVLVIIAVGGWYLYGPANGARNDRDDR